MSSKSKLIIKNAIIFLVFFISAVVIFHMDTCGPGIGRYSYFWLFSGLIYVYLFMAGMLAQLSWFLLVLILISAIVNIRVIKILSDKVNDIEA